MTRTRLAFELDPQGGKYPSLQVLDDSDNWTELLRVQQPASLTLLYDNDPYVELSAGYGEVVDNGNGTYRATATLTRADGASFKIEDVWTTTGSEADLTTSRSVTVIAAGDCRGFRTALIIESSLPEGAGVRDFEYLAPGAFYRHLDLDGDGVPNNYGTYNVTFNEDRLAFPAVMAFHPTRRFFAALYRSDCAEYDTDVLAKTWTGERFFTLDTDMGSLGFQYVDGGRPADSQVALRAYYPYYEGSVSYALDRKGYPWGVFAPATPGKTIECSHGVLVESADSFADACWTLNSRMIDVYRPRRVELKYSFEEVNRCRIEFLNSFFYEFDKDRDANEPAGYIINQHPLEGRTLAHVYEYGFTGLQLRNAYNSMRYGHEHGVPEFVATGEKTIKFFIDRVVRDNGFAHAAYSADEQCFVSWYQGLLLPYSFATTRDEQEQYLGKQTVDGLATIHDELKRVEGSYTLPMAEEGFSLLTCWELERQHGNDHPEWLAAARRIADFLLRIQNVDGSWYRSVDLDGNPVRVPEAWFGRSEDMRKSTTYTCIPLMVKLYELTGNDQYLRSARRAADFTVAHFVDRSYIYGTILDHSFDAMRAAGPGMDNSAPMLAMEALLYLYEVTEEQKYLDAAVSAAKISATWIILWDVPVPAGTTLHRFGFRSTGWSPAFTLCTSWTTDMSPLLFVRDFVKIAELTGDDKFLTIAELMQHAMNDMVSTPAETYGYAHHGLQTEGRVLTWYLIKDWAKPAVDGEGHEFGGRSKGEENKTAYPWIYAVSVGGYYRMVDDYGSVDFDAIRKELFN